jgi:hypothetical protein
MPPTQVVKKKAKCRLVGVDGNAYSVMGHFSRCARQSGWTNEEIDLVMKEAMSSNYEHLLATIAAHCDEPLKRARGGFSVEEENDDDDEGDD